MDLWERSGSEVRGLTCERQALGLLPDTPTELSCSVPEIFNLKNEICLYENDWCGWSLR